MIPSNKVYLPPKEEYTQYLDRIWENGWVTNNGELLRTLESRLEDTLGAKHVRVVANGTLALQVGLRALNLTGEVITTSFSYVATTSALIWESGVEPVFADIQPDTFNIDPGDVEDLITDETSAILPTHVFGVPCDVDRLDAIAKAHNLHVMYDGAHAVGTRMGDRSVLLSGDLTAVSFHGTKLFHTVEGGALVTDDDAIAERIDLVRAFGHVGNDHHMSGINAKNSEFHAAMGLCLLPRLPIFIKQRKQRYEQYRRHLQDVPVAFQTLPEGGRYNYAYFPVLFSNPEQMVAVQEHLADNDIHARRYFTPALNQLPYVDAPACPVAESVSRRILCLPFFQEITEEEIARVAAAVAEGIP